jgi:hypothetical protein
MTWRDQYFIDLTLLFGLRSAPFIFDSVANMVQWILQHRYQVRYLFHYLDDFITLGPAASNECAENIGITKVVFARLGLPLHPSKCEGPTTILVFLGIELDKRATNCSVTHRKIFGDVAASSFVGIQSLVYTERT